MAIPDTVKGQTARDIYQATNDVRIAIKGVAEAVNKLRNQIGADPDARSQIGTPGFSEAISNITLSYRHLEDASMRCGKVLQAIDGGASVYDKRTTVGVAEQQPSRRDVDAPR